MRAQQETAEVLSAIDKRIHEIEATDVEALSDEERAAVHADLHEIEATLEGILEATDA